MMAGYDWQLAWSGLTRLLDEQALPLRQIAKITSRHAGIYPACRPYLRKFGFRIFSAAFAGRIQRPARQEIS